MKVLNFCGSKLLTLFAISGVAGAFFLGASGGAQQVTETTSDGWVAFAPRHEIRPDFGYDSKGGPDGKGCFSIKADRRDGLDGCWKKAFPVSGGKHYHFAATYQAKGVAVPRRSVVAMQGITVAGMLPTWPSAAR